ncbi:hypothetical protein N7486_004187 [Penicillium sp. IBT 16267x]|nr:hypothetical protein N7486_010097 [Penicillium sp. IBT 16267x]KAJ6103965.1 hypothetical protein N7486_004187 [Penicillium sp. IBT 16267x]
MCHAIVWYHALCQHLDQSQTSTIPCFYATTTGYDCLPHYQPIIDFPLSGECCSCKGERRWLQKQLQAQRKHADNPLPIIANGDEITEFDVERGLERHSQAIIDGHMHLWIGGTDLLAAGSEVNIHSDLDDGLGNSGYDASHNYEEDDEIDAVYLEDLEDRLSSSPCSEMELGRDECESDAEGGDFPDSPMLGYAGSWDVILQRSQSRIPKSKIPVPASRNKVLERVWTAYELELFDQLTF